MTGLYDANRSIRLLVEVAGVVYELGKNSELTVLNGVWTLDLTELITPLPSGNYEIWVTTIDIRGAESRGQGQLIITHVDETEESTIERGDLPSTGQAILWVIVGASTLILLAILLISGKSKRRR